MRLQFRQFKTTLAFTAQIETNFNEVKYIYQNLKKSRSIGGST